MDYTNKDLTAPKFGHYGFQLKWKFKGTKSAVATGYYGEYLIRQEKFLDRDMWIGYFTSYNGVKENLSGFSKLPSALNWAQEWEDNMCTNAPQKFPMWETNSVI